MNIRQIFGLLAAIACAGSVQAQRVGWEADFKKIGRASCRERV